jgi:hypothetical protein
MIGMEVCDEHAVQVREPNRAHQLALCAFAAVEQEPGPAPAHKDRGQPPPGARHRAAGAGEEDREVHGRNGSGGEQTETARCSS